MDAYRITNEVNEEQKCNLMAAVSTCFGNAGPTGQRVDVYNMIYGPNDTGFQPIDKFGATHIINAMNHFCNDLHDKITKVTPNTATGNPYTDDEIKTSRMKERFAVAENLAEEIALMRNKAMIAYEAECHKMGKEKDADVYDKFDKQLRAAMFAKMSEEASGCFVFTYNAGFTIQDTEWIITYTDQKPAEFLKADGKKEFLEIKNTCNSFLGKATPYAWWAAYLAGTVGIGGIIYSCWNYIKNFFSAVWGYMPFGGNTEAEKASYSMAAKAAMFVMFTIVVAAIFYVATTENAFESFAF